ncbi:MAG: 1-acyl-sn-glycerol-3-phosphate acyltransferase [Deltaproteobacteria bacterium HGW-Deltaproteobacteria-13]|jgi:1-acyl-sn-glycerol-3-phosphate acyltransferase|nr:MAG: 1-acyl-sn-glycerol-3-phosphate acyltransferase [Deltaproteobacteria bacterium HGW-Deltaproteobacteria-13]
MPLVRFFQRIPDLLVTLILWCYFLFGYLFILPLLFIPAYIFAENGAAALQNLNHFHLKCFFALTRFLVPRTTFKISKDVRDIHSSVIVCNHLSYLDPILLISLFGRHRTIVKHTFFKVPIFGRLLKNSGYISSGARDMLGPAMINNLEDIKKHLAEGGILFVFPEGTRSRDGRLAPFNKGVFTIARYCNAPLKLVFINGTNRLFPPGHFLFNTHEFNEIKLELIGSLEPDYKGNNFSISSVADETRKIFEEKG